MDLVLRLREEMQNRSSYDKVFQQIWCASGGWAAITCPCGVVYSIKFNIRAESPRDFAELLLSWKHFPNVTIYDFARGLATHTNLREPEILPFSPHEGRVSEPTPENIQLAKESKLIVNLPWLKVKQQEKDPTCHPLTGSSDHYALYDRFHEYNTKDALRRIHVVPELSGWLNTQTAEQLFAGMRKKNYFMNVLTPSAHIFLMRNIIHHYNKLQNECVIEKFRKNVSPDDQFTFNDNGQVIIGNLFCLNMLFVCVNSLIFLQEHYLLYIMHQLLFYSKGTPPQSVKIYDRPAENQKQNQHDDNFPIQCSTMGISTLQHVQPNKACWTQSPSSAQLEKLNHALMETEPQNEFLASIGTTVLTRQDFLTLGHLRDVEATILNACLSIVKDVAGLQGVMVHAFSSYVTVTWLPPLCADPLSNVPENLASQDIILLPSWTHNHWMICITSTTYKPWDMEGVQL
ncbi:uncharacterized protein carm1l isoform X1 [Triplophysa rosa]|uniref:uncharacterized protein carm1l isoform X1 n=1 Tax=Triplophysa rosa TaxID=992332 RepID=UPI002545E4E5|nr:uncharacterized protein carm1l isoform X1 [Triplophysa rosa]XP_057187763.1 uncharacterized protein carm1l isoform X1 [Triplophysa rosa]XP_057187771.1 uncharacterized protein carm1l isoform X1 [Triplophysa rosa]XP_057187779.1 uncharacterized protein carm1l isoform X1 [Triplophysa rosa]XP_057187786.1 uncharacterized protein carm1l isoform X1 [Triplophysa rosa]